MLTTQRRCSGSSGGKDESIEIAEKHGVTPSAVSKWNSTLEEEVFTG